MEIQEWKEKNKQARKYAHFDEKVSLEKIWDYISKPNNVSKHGFYPFIHYSKTFNKYKKCQGKGEIKEKTRELCYSAHTDRYIYSYYGYLINQAYNEYMKTHGMDMVAVAYRDNLKKNNIHFAKVAFDYIRKFEECYVIIGDFTHFFDSLQHDYLKKRLCNVLGEEYLPEDYYAVFKNITKYSIWELVDILELNGLNDTEDDIKRLNGKRRALDLIEFKKNKSKFIKPHNEKFGIPQGSAISAALANVYMILADETLNEIAKTNSGLYMRYSDDFIVVLPEIGREDFKRIFNQIISEINAVPKLDLQAEKTQIFQYENMKLTSCNNLFLDNIENGKNVIDYLGFSFDGKEITIRDKTITKYYYRLYRKLNTIVKSGGYTSSGKRISCNNVYEKYSKKGARLKDRDGNIKGNFITYVQRAQKVFGEESIDKKTKNHMAKIRKRLKQVF